LTDEPRESNRFITNALSHTPSSLSYNLVYAHNLAERLDNILSSCLRHPPAFRLPIKASGCYVQ
jgi:hypothetical protein